MNVYKLAVIAIISIPATMAFIVVVFGKSRDRMCALHNFIAHPITEAFFWLSFKGRWHWLNDLGNKLHNATSPSREGDGHSFDERD